MPWKGKKKNLAAFVIFGNSGNLIKLSCKDERDLVLALGSSEEITLLTKLGFGKQVLSVLISLPPGRAPGLALSV